MTTPSQRKGPRRGHPQRSNVVRLTNGPTPSTPKGGGRTATPTPSKAGAYTASGAGNARLAEQVLAGQLGAAGSAVPASTPAAYAELRRALTAAVAAIAAVGLVDRRQATARQLARQAEQEDARSAALDRVRVLLNHPPAAAPRLPPPIDEPLSGAQAATLQQQMIARASGR